MPPQCCDLLPPQDDTAYTFRPLELTPAVRPAPPAPRWLLLAQRPLPDLYALTSSPVYLSAIYGSQGNVTAANLLAREAVTHEDWRLLYTFLHLYRRWWPSGRSPETDSVEAALRQRLKYHDWFGAYQDGPFPHPADAGRAFRVRDGELADGAVSARRDPQLGAAAETYVAFRGGIKKCPQAFSRTISVLKTLHNYYMAEHDVRHALPGVMARHVACMTSEQIVWLGHVFRCHYDDANAAFARAFAPFLRVAIDANPGRISTRVPVAHPEGPLAPYLDYKLRGVAGLPLQMRRNAVALFRATHADVAFMDEYLEHSRALWIDYLDPEHEAPEYRALLS